MSTLVEDFYKALQSINDSVGADGLPLFTCLDSSNRMTIEVPTEHRDWVLRNKTYEEVAAMDQELADALWDEKR